MNTFTLQNVSNISLTGYTGFRLHVDGGGTRIEQAFQVVKAPKVLDVIYATAIPNHRDRDEALAGDLRRIGALAGAGAPIQAVAASS